MTDTTPPYAQLDDAEPQPPKLYKPSKAVQEKAYVKSLADYNRLYRQSIDQPEAFWGEIAREFHWNKEWDTLHSHNYNVENGAIDIKWFEGGETNICYNCLDRHIDAGHGDRVAYHWEGNEVEEKETVTYAQLFDRVKRAANVLKAHGVKKGDTVAIYMPMIVDLVVVMLACARIGAPHSIVFGGFSAQALSSRIIDAESKIVITADGSFRGKKFIGLKAVTDDAIAKCKEQGWEVDHCLVSQFLGDSAPEEITMVGGRDKWLHEEMANASSDCDVEWVDAEHTLFLLYTSGSTGTPKGVVHTHGGYMVWASITHKYTFDYHEDDVFWCGADIGWITGHTYITYGPLCNRATSVMFNGIPTYPSGDRCWDMIDRYNVSAFYTAPTAIRALMRLGDEFPLKHEMKNLRVIGTVGEPINPEAWLWYYKNVGKSRCTVTDTWFQTETGAHMLTPLPGATPTKPGSATLPFFGVVPAVVDSEGKELEGACEGYLVIKQPWPGQMRTVYKNHTRFERTYFTAYKGYYFSGDGVKRDEHGYYWITGRVDDVVNVSGHRLGTAELEGAMAKHEKVVETAIVAIPHAIKGEGIYCYVTPAMGVEFTDELVAELRQHMRKEIGALATPDVIQHAPGLPKTRSGKVMRRVLRKIAAHEEKSLGDLSTIADPAVIDELLEKRPTTANE